MDVLMDPIGLGKVYIIKVVLKGGDLILRKEILFLLPILMVKV